MTCSAPPDSNSSSAESAGTPARRGQVVKRNQALAEAVTAATATEDQRHRRCGNRAVIVADKTLEDTRFAPTATGSRGRCNPLLVRAAKKQGHQFKLVQ